MSNALFEQEADFIKNLKKNTGKTLQEWFDTITASGLNGFLDIRKWLVNQHQAGTSTATTLTQLFLEQQEQSAPKVWFSGGGRGGDMGYESKEGSFNMYWEMGGGDVLTIIDVPTEEHWAAATKIPLEKRKEVLDFIGHKTVERQTTSGRVRIW